MSTCAIIPVCAFEHAKSRLAPVLSPRARADYARLLFERVVSAAHNCAAVDRVLVATNAGVHIAPSGCEVLADPLGASLGTVVDAALGHAYDSGAQHAIVLMSDLPLITAPDLDQLATLSAERSFVVVPDASNAGTSALAVRLPSRYPTCFGNADSFERHRALDGCVVFRNPRIARDIDTPDDYNAIEPHS